MIETETYTVEYRDLTVPERVQIDTDNLSDAWRIVDTVEASRPYTEVVRVSPNMAWGSNA
jgi:hypothetical protein